jgi:nucleoside-diphosphate-sugar epimerase
MHAILGAGGTISHDLEKVLSANSIPFRSVSRSGKTSAAGHAFVADISTPQGAQRAVEGCEVAYLIVGLPYKHSVWQAQWVPLAQNVIDACARTGTRLIFLDNIYMLADDEMPHMTEASAIKPSSRKGKVRADVNHLLLDAFASGKVQGIIARAADFYGFTQPFKSLLLDLVIRRMAEGKRPQWMYTTEKKHAFTYIPDIARALFAMSQRPDAFNRIWNLPTAPAITLNEFIAIINRQLGMDRKHMILGEALLTVLRLMVPAIQEMKELKYQMVQDYVFDSSAFEAFFAMKPTPYETGLAEVLGQLRAEPR